MTTIPNLFALAQRHHRAGRLAEAERGYREILAADPNHAGSLQFLGLIAHQLGRGDTAVQLIGRALSLRPASAEAHVNLANVLKDQGNLELALAHYEQALALQPRSGEIHYSIGVVLHLQGELDRAVKHYESAIAFRPNFAEAQLNLGTIHSDRGELKPALKFYRQAAKAQPDYLLAQMNLGMALSRQGDSSGAAACFERAAAIAPDHLPAHLSLGRALAELGRPDAAVASFRRALALAPNDAEAHLHLGTALAALGNLEEAIVHYERALILLPGYAIAHMNLGTALRDQNKFDRAIAQYRQALDREPTLAEAHYNLGLLFQQLGRCDESALEHERALALKPEHGPAKFVRCMAELPILYMDEPEIAQRRAAYRQRLRELCGEIDRKGAGDELAAAVGSNQPFFLAYQQQNDRELQAQYGAMVCGIMADKYPTPKLRRPRDRVRVGMVSGFFCNHTVWKLFLKGWLSRLDRHAFQVFGYHTGIVRDVATTASADLCDRFVRGPLPAERWRETILADRPDILIYPELGMDPMAGWLAAQRLACVQCTSWGHPVTSGLPTMDYFLSSEAMEPPDGQQHYTERLIRLPKLSIYYEPPEAQPVAIERSELGLRPNATVFWCAQSLYKYLPQYDCIFPRIARELEDVQFVFIQYPYGDHLTKLFRNRLDRAFAAVDLQATDFCVFLPFLEERRFVAAAGLCDVVLDSIGWSGGVSTLESLLHDLPIVTLPGPLMRGRHTTAMLELMQVTNTIVATVDDYVSHAACLARDLEQRTEVKKRIAVAKNRLYRDDTCIAALQEFLLAVTRGEGSRGRESRGSVGGRA